ncbi:YibE/F family protein [Lactobacillaceae bacterium 24-114]
MNWSQKNVWLLVGFILIGIFIVVFTTNDQRFYHEPIAKINTVKKVSSTKVEDEFNNVDYQTVQQLTATILNGEHKGEKVSIQNTYSKSQAMDQKYRQGDQVFLTQMKKHDGKLTASIKGYKRDTVVAFLGWLVVFVLIMSMGRAGFFALISVIINTILFVVAIFLDLRMQGNNIILLFSCLAVIFVFISLMLILGISKKMLATFAATVIGTLLATLIGILVLNMTHNKDVYYESMEYVTQVPRSLFIIEIILGALGAIMDEATDIVATLFELKELDPNVSRGQLFMAGRNIGRSIMGPLVNVLFLIFIADTFTSTLLYLKNGNSWGYTFNMNMSLGMVQSLISGIGIVLTVPVVSLFGALLLGRRDSNN